MPDPLAPEDVPDLQVPEDRLDRVDEATVREDLRKTARALEAVEAHPDHPAEAEEVVEMAQAYLYDARHFAEDGDLVRALSAVYYAHAWLDAGVRVGMLEPTGAEELFTSDV
jgi:hypothetical protein